MGLFYEFGVPKPMKIDLLLPLFFPNPNSVPRVRFSGEKRGVTLAFFPFLAESS